MVAQALRQASTDVAIEAWADRSAKPRDIAQLMAEVQSAASTVVRKVTTLDTMCAAYLCPSAEELGAYGCVIAMRRQRSLHGTQ